MLDNKKVYHRWTRTPNRGETIRFDRWLIHISGNHTKIDIFSFDKDNKESCHSIDGPIEKAFPETLKYIPTKHIQEFTSDFSAASINNVIQINKKKRFSSNR